MIYSKVLKWLIGAGINSMMCILISLITLRTIGWDFFEVLIIGGLIQLILMVPGYAREINILPLGSPVTFRGMSRYDTNANPMFMAMKTLLNEEEVKPLNEISQKQWYVRHRSLF